MQSDAMKICCYLSLFLIALSCETTKKEQESLFNEKLDYPFDYVNDVSQQFLYPLKPFSTSNHEIRLWLNYESFDASDLIVIKDIGSITFLTKYHYNKRKVNRAYFIDSVTVINENASISAKELSKKLYATDFKKLVSQPDSVKEKIGDGTTYIVELRDSTYYKLVHYNSPSHFDDNNHQSFMEIIRILEPALNWKYEKW